MTKLICTCTREAWLQNREKNVYTVCYWKLVLIGDYWAGEGSRRVLFTVVRITVTTCPKPSNTQSAPSQRCPVWVPRPVVKYQCDSQGSRNGENQRRPNLQNGHGKWFQYWHESITNVTCFEPVLSNVLIPCASRRHNSKLVQSDGCT